MLTYDRILYLAGAVVLSALALAVLRAFTQQASRITALIAQLSLHTSRPAIEPASAGSQTSERTSGTLEKALSLSQAQEAFMTTSTTTMHGLTASIEHMAEHIARSATVAEQAVTHAQSGSTVLGKTIQGIGHMRLQVQDTAKRLQHLETHACEVSEIGQRIADLADHTSVLALNVSVHAMHAGEVGQDSAVIAAEVEHLADRTVTATQRIAHLVHTIQRETNEVVTALELRGSELAQWVEATQQAGQVLRDIEQTATHLSELIQATSQAVAQQASSSATLSRAMGEMTTVTQQTTAWTRQVAASMNNLTALAGSLHSSVHGQQAA